MNRINVIIDYHPKYDMYSIKMIENSDVILCNEFNLIDITQKMLKPEITFTQRAEENLGDDLKNQLKNLEEI